ncbi:hypothetical protein JW948_07040 [bacterium]|nr:hypothetical protein [bacterium]
MNKISTALILGAGAGLIDVIPMLVMKLDWHANAAAFVHWVAMGVVIVYVNLPLKGWLKGLLLSLLLILSTLFMVMKESPRDMVPIFVSTVILGSLIGWLSEKRNAAQT